MEFELSFIKKHDLELRRKMLFTIIKAATSHSTFDASPRRIHSPRNARYRDGSRFLPFGINLDRYRFSSSGIKIGIYFQTLAPSWYI